MNINHSPCRSFIPLETRSSPHPSVSTLPLWGLLHCFPCSPVGSSCKSISACIHPLEGTRGPPCLDVTPGGHYAGGLGESLRSDVLHTRACRHSITGGMQWLPKLTVVHKVILCQGNRRKTWCLVGDEGGAAEAVAMELSRALCEDTGRDGSSSSSQQ